MPTRDPRSIRDPMATTKRRICTFCTEELAPTAYFRHLHNRNGTVCPGKRKRCTTNEDVVCESDLSFDVKSPRTLDSTFEIESSDEESNSLPEPCEEVLSNPITLPDEPLHDNSTVLVTLKNLSPLHHPNQVVKKYWTLVMKKQKMSQK